jgi:glyoxylase-like metal-dependent hydrolase (beta-lactamase superfamily II)
MFLGLNPNTWVASSGDAAVIIDPGPAIESHLGEIKATLEGLSPLAVLVTHCHPDHSEAANRLADELRVPTMACCEGPGLRPDQLLRDGQQIGVGDAVIDAIHTPGHTPDHYCFRTGASLFSGDHLVGGNISITENMTDYFESLRKLQGIGIRRLLPGHGPIMRNAETVIQRIIDHREERERQILAVIERGVSSVGGIVERVYTELDPAFHGMAARSVGAHLRKLAREGLVELPEGSSDWLARLHVPGSGVGSDGDPA